MSLIVRIETISFEREPSSLPLLMNQQHRVVVPEWVTGMRSLPVACAGPNALHGLTLSVELSCTEPADQIHVRALRTAGTSASVRDVEQFPADFGGTRHASVSCHATLLDARVAIGSVVWQWQFWSGSRWEDVDVSTHEIAITLAAPTPPWSTAAQLPWELPWWEVIRHACAAAAGASGLDEAADRVTEQTYAAWRTQAYIWQDSMEYATDNSKKGPGVFDCAKFLRLLSGERLPDLLDCADLAAVLSTFANVLGCALQQIAIDDWMIINPYLPVGQRQWLWRGNFGVHEFTVTGTSESDMRVWDGCLQISSNSAPDIPGTPPMPADLPKAMPASQYLDRLICDNTMTIAERSGRPGIRSIGPLPARSDAVTPTTPSVHAGSRIWIPPAPLRDSGPRVQHVVLRGILSPDLWEVVQPIVEPDPSAPDAERDKVTRIAWRSTTPPVRLVSCDLYVCADTETAHLRTQALLGGFGALPIEQLPGQDPVEGIPEFRFDLNNGTGRVGTLLNVAFVVRRSNRGDLGYEVQTIFDAVRAKILDSRLPPF